MAGEGAAAYARWAGMSLPSEVQFEYAMACLADPEAAEATGIQRLLGVIRHFCMDTYDESAYARHEGTDPVNTEPGHFISVRGLSRFMNPVSWSRTERQFCTRNELALDLGFRCAVRVMG